jgi:hypothetical protein
MISLGLCPKSRAVLIRIRSLRVNSAALGFLGVRGGDGEGNGEGEGRGPF